MTEYESPQHRERRNNAERLAGALIRHLDTWGVIQQLSLRLSYNKEQLKEDIQSLYEFVSEHANEEREQFPD